MQSTGVKCTFRLRHKQKKTTHILRKPKTSPTKELRQSATKCFRWEMFFNGPYFYSSHSLPFTSNGRRTQRFAPITLLRVWFGSVTAVPDHTSLSSSSNLPEIKSRDWHQRTQANFLTTSVSYSIRTRSWVIFVTDYCHSKKKKGTY